MGDLDSKPLDDLLEHALPEQVRSGFERERLLFILEELNCLGDRLRFCRTENLPEEAESVRAQIGACLEALRWTADDARRAAWEFARGAPYRHPEDAFAPALALTVVGADGDELRAWVAALPDDSRTELGKTPEVFPASSSPYCADLRLGKPDDFDRRHDGDGCAATSTGEWALTRSRQPD